MCDRWQIIQYATNQLSKDERVAVENHLRECAECRAFLRECQTLRVAVKNKAQARVSHLPPLRIAQFKEGKKLLVKQKRSSIDRVSAYAFGFALVASIIMMMFMLSRVSGPNLQGIRFAPFIQITNTPTMPPIILGPIPSPLISPSANITPTTAIPFTGFRGTIHMRFKLVITTDNDKTPSEDWQLYLWNDLQSESSRWELYRTCKDSPISPHNPTSQAELEKIGAMAFLNGPMFERCLKPWTIQVRNGIDVQTVDLRRGNPDYLKPDDQTAFLFIGGFTASMPGYPVEVRSAIIDPDYSELIRKLTEMRYENIRQTGTEIIAGRKTVMFEMTSQLSKTSIPPGAVEELSRTIWVDPETHVIMGSESLDKNGVSILAWAFTDFELNPQLTPNLFRITDPKQPTKMPTFDLTGWPTIDRTAVGN